MPWRRPQGDHATDGVLLPFDFQLLGSTRWIEAKAAWERAIAPKTSRTAPARHQFRRVRRTTSGSATLFPLIVAPLPYGRPAAPRCPPARLTPKGSSPLRGLRQGLRPPSHRAPLRPPDVGHGPASAPPGMRRTDSRRCRRWAGSVRSKVMHNAIGASSASEGTAPRFPVPDRPSYSSGPLERRRSISAPIL